MTACQGGLLIAIGVAFLASRCYLLLRYRWVGSDAYYHFVVADQIRAQGTTQPHNARFLRPEQVHYPPLLPWLLAQVPTQWRCALQYLAPATEVGTLVAVTIIAWQQWGPTAALVAASVYTTTPAAFDLGYALSPRPLANLYLALLLLPLVWGPSPSPIEVCIFAGLGAAVLLTHRLTTQSLLAALFAYGFFAPLTTLWLATLAVGLALGLTHGAYRSIAYGHLAFLGAMQPQLTAQAMLHALSRVCLGNPHLLVLGTLLVVAGSPVGQHQALACIAVLLVLAICWPFGEGDRHFANAAPLVAVVLGGASTSLLPAPLLLVGIAAGGAIIAAKNLTYARIAAKGTGTIVTKPLRTACAYLHGLHHNGTQPLVLAWPQSLSYQVMYFGAVQVVLGSGGCGAGLAYNRDLRTRVQHNGLYGLHADEQPAFVVVLDRVMLEIPSHEWQPVFVQDGVSIYRRRGSGALNES